MTAFRGMLRLLLRWAVPPNVYLYGLLSGLPASCIWVHVAFRNQPRWLAMPVGLLCAVLIFLNWLYTVRVWRRTRDKERDDMARHIIDS